MSQPKAEHGAALRVPPLHDTHAWTQFVWWLGQCGRDAAEAGLIEVKTATGWTPVRPGDWVILSATGRYFAAAVAA